MIRNVQFVRDMSDTTIHLFVTHGTNSIFCGFLEHVYLKYCTNGYEAIISDFEYM